MDTLPRTLDKAGIDPPITVGEYQRRVIAVALAQMLQARLGEASARAGGREEGKR